METKKESKREKWIRLMRDYERSGKRVREWCTQAGCSHRSFEYWRYKVLYMAKIVVLDGYTENPGDLSWADLESLGSLTVYDRTPEDKIIERIGDADCVYTNKTPVTGAALDAYPNVKFIGVLATGYNVVDSAAVKDKGVVVSNIPTYGTAAVGQFAIAMLLEICHHIGHHNDAVHAGRWENNEDWCFWDYPLIELAGKTIGVIGFGRIWQTTGKIARAMGMKVLVLI